MPSPWLFYVATAFMVEEVHEDEKVDDVEEDVHVQTVEEDGEVDEVKKGDDGLGEGS